MASVPPPDTPDTSPVQTPAEPSMPPAEVGPMPGDVDVPAPTPTD